jgi:hydroxymethylpyrimidine pyrophosphatase-like HAD family hydrolase
LNIKWNPGLKLVVSDVDETVADLYTRAEPEMIKKLEKILSDGIKLFFVTGQGLKSVQWRIVDFLPKNLRKNILVGHCSGAEVWGYKPDGELQSEPYYSIYDLTSQQKTLWREIVQQVIQEFKLKVFSTMPVKEFLSQAGNDPLSVMLEDRGPQITFEMVNGYDLNPDQMTKIEINVPETHGAYDLRIPVLERADELFEENNIPISSRLGGTFAIDFAVKNVSKTTAVRHVLETKSVLNDLGLESEIINHPEQMEIWGDKFSTIRGGTDRHMSEALPKQVRSIDFREENPGEFLPAYNIVVWDGSKHLHHGLLEYLSNSI